MEPDVDTSNINGAINDSGENSLSYNCSGGTVPAINGISNGLAEKHKSSHKSEHKDRDKHKDKHRDKDREKDRQREKDREKDKHKHSSSSSHKSKDGHSSSSSKDKEKDRHKEKEKHREKDREREKDRDKEKNRDKDKEKDRDKEKSRDKDKEHRSSSSSHKDKDRKDKSESKHSSSSSSKHSSSKDKDRSSSSSKDKDKQRDKSKHDEKRHSSSKDKERREKEHRDSKSKDHDGHKEKDNKSSETTIKVEVKEEEEETLFGVKEVKEEIKEEVKAEIKDNVIIKEEEDNSYFDEDNSMSGNLVIKEEDSDDDQPLSARTTSVKREIVSDDDEDIPLSARKKPKKEKRSKFSDEEEDDYKPEKKKKSSNKRKKGSDYEEDYEDEEDFKPAKKKSSVKKKVSVKSEPGTDENASPRKKKKQEEEGEVWKWIWPNKERKTKEGLKILIKEETRENEFKQYLEDLNKGGKRVLIEEQIHELIIHASSGLKVTVDIGTADISGMTHQSLDLCVCSLSKIRSHIESRPEESHTAENTHLYSITYSGWEEEKKPDGVKWNFLEHKGPVFAPPYEPLPPSVKFLYDGKEMRLSEEAEEVATFYGRMIEHDYTTKEKFNKNFFKDWRKVMTSEEKEKITDLKKCNFKYIHAYFQQKSEERKAMSKEEKKAIKEKNEELIKEYGFCFIDGHKEKIGNFKIEPPSLFRGRGEHPKMGMLKKRVQPEDVLINCSRDSKIPVPPAGHKWKEIKHDNTVTWLASWTENVQGQVKYVMLNPSSKLKGEKDWQKYETARKLAHSIDKIREDYQKDWKSKEMRIRQRAVAMYFIDKLALRAGNEKDEDQADTVGCCSLRVEHISLHPELDGKEHVVVFDFLGKDSIRYYNEVPVEKRVFKNLQLFMESKKPTDDLFDRLTTTILNKHLNELMEGLTAKVFRTYNASWTLQEQLQKLTDPNYTIPEMILAYNRANRAVAILCNHQRSVPKSHETSMEKLKEKIGAKKEQIEEAERQYKSAKKEAKHGSAKEKIVADKKKKCLDRLREQLTKLEVQETDREENKTIALGTSKLNYLDPRISVAWCKKYNVPIEKIYNKTQRDKFRWAIDMAGPEYVF